MSDELETLLETKVTESETESDNFGGARAPKVVSSPCYLITDKYHRDRAETSRDEILKDFKYFKSEERANKLASRVSESALTDLRTAMFEPYPEIDPMYSGTKSAEHAIFMAELQDSSAFRELRDYTVLDEDATQNSCLPFMLQYERYIQAREQYPEEDPDLQAASAVYQGSKEAKKNACDNNELEDAFGCGKGTGPSSSAEREAIQELFKKVRGNDTLLKIIRKAGRLKRILGGAVASRSLSRGEEVTGFEYGRDLPRVLPSGLAGLVVPELELDFYRRFAEGSLLCLEASPPSTPARGPFIVAVDESGSMAGDMNIQAKALALAFLWVAGKQNRWCAAVSFSDGPPKSWVFPTGVKNKTQNLSSTIEFLTSFMGRGTQFPFTQLSALYKEMEAPSGKTDIIFITDGQADLSGVPVFNEWRTSVKAKCYGFAIREQKGAISSFCDGVVSVKSLEDTDAESAAGDFAIQISRN